MATLPGTWRYTVSAGTGRPGVSILWLGEVKVWSATCISVWQHVKLSEQIRPWDTLACCWDVKQPTNQPTPTLVRQGLLWHLWALVCFHCGVTCALVAESTHCVTLWHRWTTYSFSPLLCYVINFTLVICSVVSVSSLFVQLSVSAPSFVLQSTVPLSFVLLSVSLHSFVLLSTSLTFFILCQFHLFPLFCNQLHPALSLCCQRQSSPLFCLCYQFLRSYLFWCQL